jgi:hypothetical protein
VISRLVVLAVLALAAIAAAEAVRQPGAARVVQAAEPQEPLELRPDFGRYRAVGALVRTRVLRDGEPYLGRAEIDAGFPGSLRGIPYSIAGLAVAPDRTLAVAVYKFPTAESPRNAIELWRDGRLLGAFTVPPGTFGAGLAFTADGRIAAVSAHDGRATLFERDGRRIGRTGPMRLLP